MGRAEPDHAPPLLIDQDRRVGSAHCLAEGPDQRLSLCRALAVSLEQDEARRIGVGQKAAFAIVERRARTTEYHRPRRGTRRHAGLNPEARSTRARAP